MRRRSDKTPVGLIIRAERIFNRTISMEKRRVSIRLRSVCHSLLFTYRITFTLYRLNGVVTRERGPVTVGRCIYRNTVRFFRLSRYYFRPVRVFLAYFTRYLRIRVFQNENPTVIVFARLFLVEKKRRFFRVTEITRP